jgi:hypothetical protein
MELVPDKAPQEGRRGRFEIRLVLLVVVLVMVFGGLYGAIFGSPARDRAVIDNTNTPPPGIVTRNTAQ